MADDDDAGDDSVRGVVVRMLMERVRNDRYPSSTMLDLIEQLMTPQEGVEYVEMLIERFRDDRYPSIPMLRRLIALSGAG